MPRLRNKANGAVVNVSDDLAALLGDGWEDTAEKPKPAGKRVASKRGQSSDE